MFTQEIQTHQMACLPDASLSLGWLLYIGPSRTAFALHLGKEIFSAVALGK
jgi:hypothetical protein